MAQKRGHFKIQCKKEKHKGKNVGVVVTFSLAKDVIFLFMTPPSYSKPENSLILTVLWKLVYCKNRNSPKYELYPATT